MIWFQRFYLDKEKDIIVDLYKEGEELGYVLRTPNHHTGNLITNLAKVCGLPLSYDEKGLKIIRGSVPCYVDSYNREVYIFRMGNTKTANIYPDGSVEMKAYIPAISKTLMSQTKDYRMSEQETIVKTYIRRECKFRTDLHTHMNANLHPDVLIALGIVHELRYPLYYIKKLELSLSREQEAVLAARRQKAEEECRDCALTGKYLTRRIDDNTFINFADLILRNPTDAADNIAKIRSSLAVMKDGQAVFTNLEKVYLYRYVFTKGTPSGDRKGLLENGSSVSAFHLMEAVRSIPDGDIRRMVLQMMRDHENPAYRRNTLFQDKLLWIARGYAAQGITYAEITDTTLVKEDGAARMLAQIHAVMPAVTGETGVTLRFLAGIRRIPLSIVRDKTETGNYFRENLEVLSAIAADPYVAGSDIIGEEINPITDLRGVIAQIVKIAAPYPGFTIRIHAGENDSLTDNVAGCIRCVRDALTEGQSMPRMRIGHGLYTPNLRTQKGKELIREIRESGAVLEFQISSNVRLNNLSSMENHPLRQYLDAGIPCVQGTDGGALYGTDSIDEQLSLEKMLGLTFEDQMRMRECEEMVRRDCMEDFGIRQRRFLNEIAGRGYGEYPMAPGDSGCRADGGYGENDGFFAESGAPEGFGRGADAVEEYYRYKIADSIRSGIDMTTRDTRSNTAAALADRIEELPEHGRPIVICGGSFNNNRRVSQVREEDKAVIDRLLDEGDPLEQFFVVGHRISGCEKYLIERNRGRYRIYAFAPALLQTAGIRKLRESGVSIRVSIETEAMGIYKSIAYEIFRERPSTLYAFDGNSAGENLIQEAKNARCRCSIYISGRARTLRKKAASLEGYVTVF